MNFDEFKNEIIKRCKAESACEAQFRRILNSETFPQIFTVLKDNFSWSCNHKIIDSEILTTVKIEAAQSEIYVNENTSYGFLLAWGSATVEAWGSATVRASGSATVRAWGSAFISSYKNIECKLSDHAIFRNTETKEITIVESSYSIINRPISANP